MNLGRWPQQQSQGHSNSPGKGSDAKGRSGKGGGKKGKYKDAGATESGCELSGIVHTTNRNKHNGWHG